MRLLSSSVLAGALLAVAAAPASALERYAAPSGIAFGSCASTAPCRIDVAVNSAPAGSDVIVPSGDYVLGTQLNPLNAITIRGTGATRPRLISTTGSLAAVEFRNGGALRRVEILASGPGQDALTLQGITAEDLLLRSESGDGVKAVGSTAGTVLRDTVIVTNGPGTSSALKLRDGGGSGVGDLTLVNLTAYASTGAAIRCETSIGTSTLVNVIARGAGGDIQATKQGVRCVTSNSAFRPAASPGLAPGAANRSDDPAFVDEAGGNLRLAAGSPLIDAGTTHLRLGTTDPDGRARILGPAPDIGAYETQSPGPLAGLVPPPAGTGSTPTTPTSPAPRGALVSDGQASAPDADGDGTPDASDSTPTSPAAVIGRTVVVLPSKGTVLVRPPGAKTYTEVDRSTYIQTGSVVDARRGTVALSSAVGAEGELQTGAFRGGLFEVRQSRTGGGMTDLVLRGGDFSRCAATARRATASARKKPVRRLWAKDDRGKFRTHGRNSVATARGTAWLTEDTCAGTRTRVSEDSVSVKPTRGKARIVRAGQQLLVRAPKKPRG